MDYLLAIIAGAVQGLTEFLPVSSTGHLIIFENLFGISQDKFGLTFDASLHLGTLLAVVLFFYKDYIKAAQSRLLPVIIIGTGPAVVAGLVLENLIETSFRHLWVVGLALVLFSLVFIVAERVGRQTKSEYQVTLQDAIIVGIFQAFALVPGISRSGSTISAGLLLGFRRQEAAKFAFMLSGPIITAAGAKKFFEAISENPLNSSEFNFFIIGIISSAVFGYFTIKYFLQYLSTKTLYPFVVYRVLLGLALLLLL